MNIFDYVNSRLTLVKINSNVFSVGKKIWMYDPDIESLIPEGYRELWARDLVKMLKKDK